MSGKAMIAEDEAEIARLRAQVAELERQLVDVEAWAARAVAEAQAKTYWLDRWHVDLNRLMRRPGAFRVRALARGGRSLYRALRRVL